MCCSWLFEYSSKSLCMLEGYGTKSTMLMGVMSSETTQTSGDLFRAVAQIFDRTETDERLESWYWSATMGLSSIVLPIFC
jgi:hypothetical protein